MTTIFGIEIDNPLGAFYFDSQEMREFSKLVLDMQRFLQMRRLKLDRISIGQQKRDRVEEKIDEIAFKSSDRYITPDLRELVKLARESA